jgi:hypothetical protein
VGPVAELCWACAQEQQQCCTVMRMQRGHTAHTGYGMECKRKAGTLLLVAYHNCNMVRSAHVRLHQCAGAISHTATHLLQLLLLLPLRALLLKNGPALDLHSRTTKYRLQQRHHKHLSLSHMLCCTSRLGQLHTKQGMTTAARC